MARDQPGEGTQPGTHQREIENDAHFRLARQLRRTLITFDRDYLDARRFPTRESAGVLVLTAPDIRGYTTISERMTPEEFRRMIAEEYVQLEQLLKKIDFKPQI